MAWLYKCVLAAALVGVAPSLAAEPKYVNADSLDYLTFLKILVANEVPEDQVAAMVSIYKTENPFEDRRKRQEIFDSLFDGLGSLELDRPIIFESENFGVHVSDYNFKQRSFYVCPPSLVFLRNLKEEGRAYLRFQYPEALTPGDMAVCTGNLRSWGNGANKMSPATTVVKLPISDEAGAEEFFQATRSDVKGSLKCGWPDYVSGSEHWFITCTVYELTIFSGGVEVYKIAWDGNEFVYRSRFFKRI